MTLLGIKPFRGTSMREVLQYLQVEAAQAFKDLFTALNGVKLAEVYLASGTDELADLPGTSELDGVASLDLDAGEWSVWGMVSFYPNGATGTLSGRAWLGLEPLLDSDTIAGQSWAENRLANNNVQEQVLVFRRLSLPKRQRVYLSCDATYTGGGPIQRLGSIWATGRG